MSYPQKWEICCRCKGEGKHDHPAFANGITSSEMAEMGQDGMDSYFAGHYDVRCDDCEGSGKVQVVDEDAMTPAQRAQWDSEADDRRAAAEDERYFAAERRAEQRMGC
jgi:RecJ-like exonuclease